MVKKSIYSAMLVGLLALGLVFTACGNDGGDPILSGTVSISGKAKVNETLTANAELAGTNGTVFYQWIRGTTLIDEASSDTYTLVSADLNNPIKVEVSREGYKGTITSLPTAIVLDADAPDLSGTVSISGEAQVGKTLTADVDISGSLTGTGILSYQWSRLNTGTATSSVAIGTNSNTYKLVADDVGKYISVTVGREGYVGTITSDSKGPVVNTPSGGSENVPAALVGTWGLASLASPYSQFFQINSNGSGTWGNAPTVGCNWKATVSTLTLEWMGTSCTVDWKIIDGKLNISNAQNDSGVTTEMAFLALNGLVTYYPILDKIK